MSGFYGYPIFRQPCRGRVKTYGIWYGILVVNGDPSAKDNPNIRSYDIIGILVPIGSMYAIDGNIYELIYPKC